LKSQSVPDDTQAPRHTALNHESKERDRCVDDVGGGGGGGGAFCVCKGVCVELGSKGGLLKMVSAAAAGLRLKANLLFGTFDTRNASMERSSSFSC
jgi:hypothetical protein